MKPALVQHAIPSTLIDQDYLDALSPSVFTNDVRGGLFFSSSANVLDTVSASAKVNFGATDLTNSATHATAVTDASASPGARGLNSITNCIQTINSNGSVRAAAAFTSAQPTGLRTTWGTVPASLNELLTCLILGDSDIANGVSSQAWNAAPDGTGAHAINHNCGDTPELIILHGVASSTIGTVGSSVVEVVGVWTAAGGWGFGLLHQNATVPTNVCAQLDSTDHGKILTTADALGATFTISAVGATQFTCTLSGGFNGNAVFYALRGVGHAMFLKAGIGTTPTAIGAQALTGAGGRPQVLLTFGTRLTGTSLVSDDTAGSWGWGVACNNKGTTQQYSHAATVKDNVNPSVAKSQTSALAMSILDNAGSRNLEMNVQSWDSDGCTPYYSNIDPAGLKFGYVMLGMPVALGGSFMAGGFNEMSGGMG